MKIWFLTSEFPPLFGGGIATYTDTMARILAQHGHQVTVLLHDPSVIDQTFAWTPEGVRVLRFHAELSANYNPLANFGRVSYLYANAVARLIQREGPPDVIESQEYHALAYQLLQRKRTCDPLLQSVPVVITAHSPKFLLDPLEEAPPYLLPDWWIGEMERFCLRAADVVIAPSEYLKNALRTALPGLSVEVIPNPFIIPKAPPPLGDGLIYLGRLQLLKGVLVLFDALSRLWDQGWNHSIDCYGGDAHFRAFNQSMQVYLTKRYQYYIDHGLIRFHGLVSPTEVELALHQAKVVVIPSLFENFPYAVVEAMGRGRIVVASNTGGQRDLIRNGDNGWLFEGGNAIQLAYQLRTAFSMEPQTLNDMGAKAYRTIAEVTNPETVLRRKLALYRRPARIVKSFPFVRPVPALPPIRHDHRELSIVIPYYNLGDYVYETLDSLRRVSGLDVEILLIDDGSTDPASIRCLYQMADTFPEITVLRTPNQGLAKTRNYGATHAHGTYLAFLDADDTVDPDYYPRALAILRHYDNVSFVGSWTQYRGESNEIWMTWNPEPPYILFRNAVNSSALVYRRQDFLEYGLNDPEFRYGYEDYESVVRMVSHQRAGVIIPELLFIYLARPNSMSHAFTNEMELYLHSLIVKKNPALYHQYGPELTQIINANWPHYTNDNPSSPF